MSSPCDFHHWCRTAMSVPTEKCRTSMSRKYFARSAVAISARGGTARVRPDLRCPSPATARRIPLDIPKLIDADSPFRELCADLEIATHRFDNRLKRADVHVGTSFHL